MITKRGKAKSGIGINLGKDMALGKIHARKMSGFLSRKSLSRKGLTREGGSRTRSERQEIATAAAAAPVFSSFEAISIFKLHCHYFSKLLLDPFLDALASLDLKLSVTESVSNLCFSDFFTASASTGLSFSVPK